MDKAFADKKIESKRIIVIAHSMGNRFLDDEMETRAYINTFGKPLQKYKALVFACADVGMEEFQDVMRVSRVGSNAEKVWVLINQKDPALKVSSKIHGFYRVGNIPPQRAVPLLLAEDSDVKVVDHTSVTGKSHSMPIDLIVDVVNGTEKNYKLIPSSVLKGVLEAAH